MSIKHRISSAVLAIAIAVGSCVGIAAPAAADSATINAGQWKKVIWGWGWYSVKYSVWVHSGTQNINGARYNCYHPWWYAGGSLPAVVTFQVQGYADCWIYSPITATYEVWPTAY